MGRKPNPERKPTGANLRVRLVTFSMLPVTLERLDKVMQWRRETNKSGTITQLIDAEYLRQLERRGDLEASSDVQVQD